MISGNDPEPEPSSENCTFPPQMDIETVAKFVLPQAEHEARDIAEYVESQARDERVIHCEMIKTEFVLGNRHDVWDVHTNQNRWWVITNPTNLYRQAEFTSLDYTLSFHIGLMARVAARNSREPDPEAADMALVFRKMEQISDTLEAADEVEDFQSVGLQCREVLIALSRALSAVCSHDAVSGALKVADFKNWAEAAANTLAAGGSASESRSFLKNVARQTWDLVNCLTHAGNATNYDAIMALLATTTCVDAFAMMLKKHRSGVPNRCPNCASYKITALYRPEYETDSGYIQYCPKCEWTDAPERVIDGGTF
jgi:hypothetical protein